MGSNDLVLYYVNNDKHCSDDEIYENKDTALRGIFKIIEL